MFNFKNTLFFIEYLLLNPRLFKALFHKIYLPTLIQYEWIKEHNIKTFIDVGCFRGEDSQAINYLVKKVKIYAFEPDIANYEYIKRQIRIPNFKIFNIAISNKVGTTKFYSHPFSFLSSQLKTISQPKDKNYLNRKTNDYNVSTSTLDIFFKNLKLKSKVLLKIDTQGTELKALQGAVNLLKKVDIIHIETSIDKIYEDQSIFNDIYDLLISNGFEFKGEAKESEFYPSFYLPSGFNSVFIKKRLNLP